MTVKVLIVEDRVSDAELMLAALRSAGIECTGSRVETEADYLRALSDKVDVILADYSLPGFSAPRALDLLSERDLDVPAIVVTGSVGEEAAIECMKKGAADYLLKDRMARLGLAVQQALDARALRQERRATQESLTFQAHLLSAVDHAVIATDLNARITYWNHSAEQLYGWTAGEVLGCDVRLVALSPDMQQRGNDIKRDFSRSTSWSGELVVQHKNGTQFPVHISMSPIRNESEELVGVIGVSHDITEQRRAEEAMRDLAKFPAENPNPVMRVFPGLRLAYANAASAAVLKAWSCQVGDLVPEAVSSTVTRCMSSGVKREIEVECGSLVFATLVVPVQQSGYCNIYFRDITAYRRADTALRASEERLRLITDHVLDLVAQTTLDGTFLYASPSHSAVLGYSPDSLVGRSAMDIVHPDHRQHLVAVIQGATTGWSDGRLELMIRHADGRYVWIEAVGALLFDELGNATGIVVSAREITQRKRLEADLQRRTEELERFNRLAVGRELRMIELKQKINELSRRLGNPPPYATEDTLKGKPA